MLAAPAQLPDGTYQFVHVPSYGPSYYVTATVTAGRVTAWAELSQDGQYRTPAAPADLERGQAHFVARVHEGLDIARRLSGLGHPPVAFVAAPVFPSHNPTTGTVYVPVQIGGAHDEP